MNDAEYLFRTDAAEKKRNGRGIYNKKGGSKSKKCTLPGDYLTDAQKKKLSKTIVEVNLREPMTWKQFKSLNPDIQKEYMIFLRDRFGVSLRDISTDLFDHAPQFISNKLREECAHLKGIFPRKPKARTNEQIKNWDLWLGKSASDTKESSGEPFVVEKTDKFHTYKPKMEKVAREGEMDVVDIKIKDELPPENDKVIGRKRINFTSTMTFNFERGISIDDISELSKLIDINADGSCVITHVEFTIERR